VIPEPHEFSDPFSLDSVVSGFRHTCGLSPANELWCWGYNERGNLGIGSFAKNVKVPTLVGSGYTRVVAGGDHTCAIDQAGKLLCWGFNASRELGVPTDSDSATALRPGCEPQNAGDACFDDYRAVGVGSFHTCGIRQSGEMRCFGGNLNGQLGIGPPTSSYQESEPRLVLGSEKWGDVSGGRSYTCGLTVAGALYCWGLNEDRQLGIPDVDFVNVPTAVPVDAPGGWRFLAGGQYHSCAIRADRTLWCWGRNSDGQVGIGTKTENPVARPTRVCFPLPAPSP
jgi:alpha-tubulin suppressor-like RCC1 family protein